MGDQNQYQYVKLPDGSYGKFAANASDDDIKGAISKDFPSAFGQTQQPAKPDIATLQKNINSPAGGQGYTASQARQAIPFPKVPFLSGVLQGTADVGSLPETVGQAFGPPKTTGEGILQTLLPGGGLLAAKRLITDPMNAEAAKARQLQAQGNPAYIGHAMASDIPILGPFAAQIGEQAGSGDVANAAGRGLINAIALKAGSSPEVTQGSLTRPSLAEANPIKAQNRLTFATGINDTEMPALIDKAMPEMQTTGPKPGGFQQVVGDTLSRLEAQFKSYLNPSKNTSVSTDPVADSIHALKTSDIIKENPNLADALDQWENKFRGQNYTLEELNNLRQRYNSDLAPLYKKGDLAQMQDLDKSLATKKALKPASDTIRDLLYGELEKQNPGVSQLQIRNLKNSEGALMRIQEELGNRMEAAQAQAAFDKGTPIGLRYQSNVRGYTTMHGPGVHIGGLTEMVRPRSVGELNALNSVGNDVFAPRTTPFAPVNAASIAAMLAPKKR